MNPNNKDSQPKRFSGTIYWWHWVTGAVLVILFTFLAPHGKSPEFAHLTEGSISKSKIIAPFDFEVLKFPEELEAERKEATANIQPVVSKNDSLSDASRRELLSFAAEVHRLLAGLPDDKTFDQMYNDTSRADTVENSNHASLRIGIENIFELFGFRLTKDSWQLLFEIYKQDLKDRSHLYFKLFENDLDGILRDVYGQGIINVPKAQLMHKSGEVTIRYEGVEDEVKLERLFTPDEALERIAFLLSERFEDSEYPKGIVSTAYEIIQPFISPNIIYDAKETKRRKEQAIARVPSASGFVKKDELIIDSNIRVTRDHLAKLNSLATIIAEREHEKGGLSKPLPYVGYGLIFMLIIAFYGIFIALVKPHIWRNWRLIVLIASILVLMHLFQVFVSITYDISHYIFPAAIFAMLVSILVDRVIGLTGVVIMAVIAGLLRGNDFPTTFNILVIGSVAVVAIRNASTRGDILKAMVYLLATYIPLVASFHFVSYTFGTEILQDYAIAGANAILSPMLSLGLIYIFERIFGITTNLTLLELVDLNQPLLKQLAIKSPGTYHHSIMVGSLAETAAREIGANALLTRAGAYYHDIGKMVDTGYFIENQEGGTENPHDRLPPSKSAEIVIKHVYRGIELADKHHLPEEIKDFIREHHGKTYLTYFHEKAKREMDGEVKNEKFQYPGPNPKSKETGIMMLADLVEAATRTMDFTTHKELKKTVTKLIRKRLAEGDLDNCPLTLREIYRIRDSFVGVLMGIHHQRVVYPGQENVREAKVEKTDDRKSEEAQDQSDNLLDNSEFEDGDSTEDKNEEQNDSK